MNSGILTLVVESFDEMKASMSSTPLSGFWVNSGRTLSAMLSSSSTW